MNSRIVVAHNFSSPSIWPVYELNTRKCMYCSRVSQMYFFVSTFFVSDVFLLYKVLGDQ